MLDYPALAALAQIIRRGSFDAAAAALGVTPSAVSQRIKSLEERLGQVLIHRGPPATGTETGLQLLRHYDQVTLLEQGLAQKLRPDDGPPALRIAVNADSLATWFPPAMQALPVLYDLVIDDQDHAREWLRKGQVSAAITSDPSPVAGCDAFHLGAMRYRALATPTFIARHFPNGIDTDSLSRAPAVIFNAKDALQSRWAELATGRKLHLHGHLIPASEPFAHAVRLGLGWGMIPEAMAPAEDATLTPLNPDLPLDVPLYWHVQRAMAPTLSPLTAETRKRAADALRP
ncbi:LysR family transcriptional regulator ArgP [Paracoccus sulfuroxidans]|uniref:LysR family transcriptional regulator (Chromosome initiation inhibitor) n=1 Tax=Paracoccus sulfuroxidans TaxID=384678 RepID=A0A562NC06_9RHOB|nr:LysR family transcriptional regulator ArgP [Paracoccus sulfuroxidans]TWI29431.1 LysR family transcriptional regulator (chromosome initiation inhibitor) [Paracoccus sulfuroxidans]